MNTMREEFEAWAANEFGWGNIEFRRYDDDSYLGIHAHTAWQAWQAARRPVGESIGTVGTMPGTDGFTMACFKADDVPVGTRLYVAPPQQPERVDWSAIKHAAHEWANLAACAAAKRGGQWKAHKAAVKSRDAAKNRFLTMIDSQGAKS